MKNFLFKAFLTGNSEEGKLLKLWDYFSEEYHQLDNDKRVKTITGEKRIWQVLDQADTRFWNGKQQQLVVVMKNTHTNEKNSDDEKNPQKS